MPRAGTVKTKDNKWKGKKNIHRQGLAVRKLPITSRLIEMLRGFNELNTSRHAYTVAELLNDASIQYAKEKIHTLLL